MRKAFHIALWLLLASTAGAQAVSHTDTTTVHTMHGTYYSDRFVGRKTSSGETFRQDRYTAAHKTLKFGTLLLVTNIHTGKQVIVRVNDRCPRTNVLDMSRKAARQIGIGSQMVNVQVLAERHYRHWENQEALTGVLAQGLYWEYVSDPEGTLARCSTAATETAPSGTDSKPATAKPSPAKSAPKPAAKPDTAGARKHTAAALPADTPLFDIVLGSYPSRNTAQKEANRLPIYYRDQADFVSRLSDHAVTLTLRLSLPLDQAEKTLKELQGMYPGAQIAKSRK